MVLKLFSRAIWSLNDVNLPVQLRRFDVAEPVGVVGWKQEDVGSDELVVLHPNDVADLIEN